MTGAQSIYLLNLYTRGFLLQEQGIKKPQDIQQSKTILLCITILCQKGRNMFGHPVHVKDLESQFSQSLLSWSRLRGFFHGCLCHTEEIGFVDYA